MWLPAEFLYPLKWKWARLACLHNILEGKEHCTGSPDPRGLTCSLTDCVTWMNNNFSGSWYPQSLRKRVGVCFESNVVNWSSQMCFIWPAWNYFGIAVKIGVFHIKICIFSFLWEIAWCDITGLVLALQGFAMAVEAIAPSPEPGPFPRPTPTPPWSHWPDDLPGWLTLKALSCSLWSFCNSFTLTI